MLSHEHLLEEVPQEVASPTGWHLPFFAQKDPQLHQEGREFDTTLCGELNGLPVVPVILLGQGETEEVRRGLGRVGEEQLELHPDDVEGGLDWGARGDCETPDEGTSRLEVVDPPELPASPGLRRLRRCNRGKPPLCLIQL